MIPDILKEIPSSTTWTTAEKIEKGWSAEQKFCAVDTHGNRFLIRLADAAKADAKKREFEIMQKVAAMGIPMSIPLDFGICEKGQHVYSLFSWVDGTALDEVIDSLSATEQYDLGRSAGVLLKKMHSLPSPPDQENWEQRLSRKIRNHIERYQNCGIRVPQDEKALKFISDNIGLLRNRPQCFQHGDFHIGNLILSADHTLQVIDFNRWDYGDPWEEFYKMCIFSREKSIPFAVGQLHGYFGNTVPNQFFELLTLYLADVILFCIVWAMPFGNQEVQGMITRANMIMADLNNFQKTIPSWFKPEE